MIYGFVEGTIYNRRADIHAHFGGQRQGGIITPADESTPIFLITSAEGAAHGYSDRLRADGVFEYFGEGQQGDMAFVRGNMAVQTHAEQGRDLLLFRKHVEGLRFLGQYVYENFHLERAPDTSGAMRDAIVFELRPLDALSSEKIIASDAQEGREPIEHLRRRALEAASSTPRRGTRLATIFERSQIITTYVFARASGICEHCSSRAPFVRDDGTPYLEAHHIRRLTDGGPDDPRYMIAVCPNCHRRAHSGLDRVLVNEQMLRAVAAKESPQDRRAG